MKLLPFELKKLLFSKRFLYLMLVILVGIAVLFLRNVIFYDYVEVEEGEEVESLVEAGQSNHRMNRYAFEQDPENEEVQKLYEISGPMLDILYELRSLVGSEDWQNKLSVENELLNYTTEYKEAGGDFPLSYHEIDRMIALNEKLISEDMKPEHDTYSKALPNFMKMVVDLFVGLGAIIIIFIIVGEIMSSEFENRSINLLFTQPLKRTHIITSKFLTSIISYLIILGIVLASAMIVGSIFGEEGTFDYPMIMEKNGVINFITVSEYMTQALIVVSVTIFMIISLFLLYSLLFKHTLSTLFVLLGTLLAGFILTAFISWPPFAWFNPFQYVLPEETLLYQNGHVWYQGIPVIVLLTIVFYLIARQKVKSIKVD